MLVITVLAILSAATGAVALASSTGTLNEPPAVGDREQGMVFGAPLQGPPDTAAAAGAAGAATAGAATAGAVIRVPKGLLE